MAKELKLLGADPTATYYVLLFNEALQVWNGTSYVTYVQASYATYDIALTQLGAMGNFYADLPAGAKAAGTIIVDYRQEAVAATQAETDSNVGSEAIYWDTVNDVRLTVGRLGSVPTPAAGAAGGLSLVGSAMTLATNAITAAVVATNAIDADALATDAVTELQVGLATATTLAAVKAKTDLLPAIAAGTNGGLPTVDGTGAVAALVTGYATDQSPAAYVLASPAQKIATNVSGQVTVGTMAAGAIASIWDALLTGITTASTIGKLIKDNLNAAITSRQASGAVTLDLTQAVPTSNTVQTVGDALNAARAQGFGKWVLVGTTLTMYAPDGTTVVRTFTLDSPTAPLSRL